jgi:hypothetical protein
MTNSASPVRSDKKVFRTPMRSASAMAVLALVAAFMSQSCGRSTDVAKPNSTTANKPAASNSQAAAPVTATPLQPAVLNTELKDLDGKSFKLSD